VRRRRLLPSWPGWRVALYGVYGIWGYHTLLVVAFSMAPALEVNVLNYTWTLWIVVLGSFVPGHRPTLLVFMGGLLGFAGVALVLGGGDLWALLTGGAVRGTLGDNLPGYLLALAAGLCWGSFTAFMRIGVPGGTPRMDLFCLLATVVAAGFLMARGAPWLLPAESWGPVLFMGLVPLGLSFLLWEQAARNCNVQVLGMMSFFTPVLSTLLLSWVRDATVPAMLFAGLGLILAGAAVGGQGVGRRGGHRPGGNHSAGSRGE